MAGASGAGQLVPHWSGNSYALSASGARCWRHIQIHAFVVVMYRTTVARAEDIISDLLEAVTKTAATPLKSQKLEGDVAADQVVHLFGNRQVVLNVLCGWLLHCKRFLRLRWFVSTVVCPACFRGGCHWP